MGIELGHGTNQKLYDMTQISEATPVDPTYRHYEKATQSHGVVHPNNSRLKWYDIARSDQPIGSSIRNLAQTFLSNQPGSSGVPCENELGFVLLHRCGEGFYFLMLCTWRENNELWKTVYYLEAQTMADFALFPQEKQHKGTFCVWEMSVVAHETQAWSAYLMSNREQEDVDTYLSTTI